MARQTKTPKTRLGDLARNKDERKQARKAATAVKRLAKTGFTRAVRDSIADGSSLDEIQAQLRAKGWGVRNTDKLVIGEFLSADLRAGRATCDVVYRLT